MIETMMHVLEALDGGGAPSGLSLQIHARSSEQHAAYLDALTSLLGQGAEREGDDAVYHWHEWRQGEWRQGVIVLHEPHSEEE